MPSVFSAEYQLQLISGFDLNRYSDDIEVGLQQQPQLYRPAHIRLHALATKDGEGAFEPTDYSWSC